MSPNLAVDRWLHRLVKYLCSERTMCGPQDISGKICILFNHCTNRNVFSELLKWQSGKKEYILYRGTTRTQHKR